MPNIIYITLQDKHKLLNLITNLSNKKQETLTLKKMYHSHINMLYKHTTLAPDVCNIIKDYMTDIFSIIININCCRFDLRGYNYSGIRGVDYNCIVQVRSKDVIIEFESYVFSFIFQINILYQSDNINNYTIDTKYHSIDKSIFKYSVITTIKYYVSHDNKLYVTNNNNDNDNQVYIPEYDNMKYMDDLGMLFDCYMYMTYNKQNNNIDTNDCVNKSEYEYDNVFNYDNVNTRYIINNHKMMRHLIVIHDVVKKVITQGCERILEHTYSYYVLK